MPELPEVETIVRQLEPKLVGKTIKAEVLDAKAINIKPKDFEKRVNGSRVKKIWRRAKLMIWQLSGEKYLVIHLKLNGRFLFFKDKEKPHKETRVIFNISGPYQIFFDDTRRFGWIKFFTKDGFEKYMQGKKFGPEPLSPKFTLKVLSDLLAKKPNAKIKPLLMDQKFIAGVGNIYAQEACFYAGIMPTRRVKTLKKREIEKLYRGLIKVLKMAVKAQGTSADAYLDIYGEEGEFLPKLKVYGREGKECDRCGGIIRAMKLAGRGTRYCPGCQK